MLLRSLALLAALALPAAHAAAAPRDAVSAAAHLSPWRASDVYTLAQGEHTLEFCTRDSGVQTSDGMVFEFLPVASTDASAIAAAAERADAALHAFSSQRVVRESVTHGTRLAVKSIGSDSSNDAAAPSTSAEYLYRVEFTPASSTSDASCVRATLPIDVAGTYVLFTELARAQVETAIHDASSNRVSVLQCVSGCSEMDATAASTLLASASRVSAGNARGASWPSPVIASLLISLTSIVGVAILSFDKGRVEVLVEYMTSFGAGCLLGVVAFHLYPEGTAYLSDVGHWIMGACVLGGIVFSMSIEAGVHQMLASFGVEHCNDGHSHGHHPHHDHATMDDLSETDRATLSPESQSPRGHSHASHHVVVHVSPKHGHSHGEHDHLLKLHGDGAVQHHHHHHRPSRESFWAKHVQPLKFVEPVAWITAVGDFFHAFTDGVVLAVAFKSCSASLGWAVALGIVLHEVPHRVGDFFIFLKAGMAVPQALAVNFAASLASLLGVVILFAWGDVSRPVLGVLLGLGTGALLFIGLTELLPPMLAVRERASLALHFVWFCAGCVVIGLSLLQDTHCHV